MIQRFKNRSSREMMDPNPNPILRQEELVYNVVIEYLNKNRTFRINDIIPYISSRFARSSININQDGIRNCLNSLLKKRVIIEDSKLTQETLFYNLNRLNLYNFIKENPGHYFYSIASNLNIAKPVIYFHLQVLMKFGYIKYTKIENNIVYFDYSLNVEQVEPLYYANKEKSKIILSYFRDNNIGHTKTHLSNTLNMHPNTILKYLDILEKYGYLFKENMSNRWLYFIRE